MIVNKDNVSVVFLHCFSDDKGNAYCYLVNNVPVIISGMSFDSLPDVWKKDVYKAVVQIWQPELCVEGSLSFGYGESFAIKPFVDFSGHCAMFGGFVHYDRSEAVDSSGKLSSEFVDFVKRFVSDIEHSVYVLYMTCIEPYGRFVRYDLLEPTFRDVFDRVEGDVSWVR